MSKTSKLLHFAVLGAVAASVVGVANLTPAKAVADVTYAKHQHVYTDSEWRHSHRHWNGRYYWHNNHYYYDHAYTYPATVDNDWATIGAGVTLNSDPDVYFTGQYGGLYPYASLNVDLGSSDKTRHARALYFQHPYFWRDGVRYDRTTVTRHGTKYYRFVRHRY